MGKEWVKRVEINVSYYQNEDMRPLYVRNFTLAVGLLLVYFFIAIPDVLANSKVGKLADFDDINVTGAIASGSSWTSGGLVFESTAATNDSIQILRDPAAACNPGCVPHTSQYLAVYNPDQTGPFEVKITREGGGNFDFASFSFATMFVFVPPPGQDTLEVIGTTPGGSTIVKNFTYDDTGDSFQVAVMGTGFQNLESVLIRSPFVFPAFDNIGYAVEPADAPDVYLTLDGVVVKDRVWRQVTDTVDNLSWDDVASVCNPETGTCSGSTGTVNFTGWTWAAYTDLNDLFNFFIGSDLLTGVPSLIFPGSSPAEGEEWADEILSYFTPTLSSASVDAVRGMVRDSFGSSPECTIPGAYDQFAGSDLIGSSVYFCTSDSSDPTRGYWLYRPLGAPTPEPGDLTPPEVIFNPDRTIEDTDGSPGESVSFSASASDEDGTVVNAEWLVNSQLAGSGLEIDLLLPDGDSQVIFEATDNDGQTTSVEVTITVEPYSVKLDPASFIKTVTESAGQAELQLNLSYPSPTDVTVRYTVESGSANAREDFASCSCLEATIIPAGETSAKLSIGIVDDPLFEELESFSVTLDSIESPTGIHILGTKTALIRIADNDPNGILSLLAFESETKDVSEDTTVFFISVNRIGDTTEPASVEYSTADESALAGEDYTAKNGSLTFEPGSTEASILLRLIDDTQVESNEAFTLNLSNAIGASIDKSTLEITINDNDEAPASLISLDQTSLTVSEGDGIIFVPVTRTGNIDSSVTVEYQSVGVEAQNGEDFITTSGTLTFNEGQSAANIPLAIIDDDLEESGADERVQLVLSSPQGPNVQLGNDKQTITIVDNDGRDVGPLTFPPARLTLNSDGSGTNAAIYGGVSTDNGLTYRDRVNVGEEISIFAAIVPETGEIGKLASIFVVVEGAAGYIQVTRTGLVPLVVTPDLVETASRLVPFDEIILEEQLDLDILQAFGSLLSLTSAETGYYRIFVAYSTGDGVVTYNDEAIELIISELIIN